MKSSIRVFHAKKTTFRPKSHEIEGAGVGGFFPGQKEVEHLPSVTLSYIVLVAHRAVIRMSLLFPFASTSPVHKGEMLLQGNDPVAIGVNPLKMTPRIGWKFVFLELPVLVLVPLLETISVDRKDKESGDCDKDERFHWRYNRPESQ